MGKKDLKLCSFCQEEESISHLLFYCIHVRPLCEVVNDVLLPGETVSHDMTNFGYDTDLILNHVFSILVYVIYREWLACYLENRFRRQQICYKSFANVLSIRNNVYPKQSHTIWTDVSNWAF